MNLYHFTTPEYALLIGMGSGLKPDALGRHGNETADYNKQVKLQTMGQPAVWLTQEESNATTAAELERYPEADAKIGVPFFGGPVRCQVFIERHNKKLVRWSDFLMTTNIIAESPEDPTIRITGRDQWTFLSKNEWFNTERAAKWWLYFGEIPARKIIVPMTRAQCIEGCDWHIKRYAEAEGRERWTQQRDAFAAQPDNAALVFEGGRCKLFLIGKAA